MNESWVSLESLARQNHREILARAAVDRLLRKRTPRRNLSVRVRWKVRTWLGQGLVSLGNRMQEADRRQAAAAGLRRAS